MIVLQDVVKSLARHLWRLRYSPVLPVKELKKIIQINNMRLGDGDGFT
jgi:hypothetical protein